MDYRPSQRPTKPSTGTKPEENSKPQEQPETSAPTKPQLACNGAVIDTSRTVVLLGYGDGLLHEDDPLTRAQLATIIYRLLDDDSIAKYSNTELAFTDVAADAWYTTYVKTIQAAGIVNGVGGGRYSPNSYITWSQLITVLTRFVQPQEYILQNIQYSGWAQGAIQTAVALNWIEDNADFTPDAVISRGELVQLVNSVLELYRA
ncbi:S-layer homology domain-containing protein [Acutalibacter sp. 1XD8-33]|nr:S-layer homology domain-containing protein [Acutalibacter sp. 1XD8-33]